jgi:hypothetical protein
MTNDQIHRLIRERLAVDVEELLSELPADVRGRVPAELFERRLLERVESSVFETLGIADR